MEGRKPENPEIIPVSHTEINQSQPMYEPRIKPRLQWWEVQNCDHCTTLTPHGEGAFFPVQSICHTKSYNKEQLHNAGPLLKLYDFLMLARQLVSQGKYINVLAQWLVMVYKSADHGLVACQSGKVYKMRGSPAHQ